MAAAGACGADDNAAGGAAAAGDPSARRQQLECEPIEHPRQLRLQHAPPSLLAPALLVVLQTAALLVLQPPATPLFKDQWRTATVATGQFGLL